MFKTFIRFLVGFAILASCIAFGQIPQRPKLEAGRNYSASEIGTIEAQTKAYLLSLVPLGTDVQAALATLKAQMFQQVDYDPHSGFVLPSSVADARGIKGQVGVKSIRVLVAKNASPKEPIVQYLYGFLGFDEKGHLIAIEAASDIDSP
jgi:hypothetical protein